MGIQKGPMRLKGTNGEFTFAETKNGFIWKKKSRQLDANRFETVPGFIKIKRTMDDFGRTGKAVKYLRTVFSDELLYAKDAALTTRLQSVMMKVTASDSERRKGEKLPGAGDLHLLENFELNGDASLQHSLDVQIESSYDRLTGKVLISVPSFVPADVMKYAPNVTHYQIVASAAEVDFAANKNEKTVKTSALIALGPDSVPALTLKPDVTPASTLPLIITLGIRFCEVAGNFTYAEKHGEFQALCIVKAERP